MGALKSANKVLLVALGVAIVLVIAAIVILAITLGKANNLNTVASNPTQTPTQVTAFYFTVNSGNVSYNDATSSYAQAVQNLQQQISTALSSSSRAAEGHFQSQFVEFDTTSSFTMPHIMGISPGSFGVGVTVMSSTTFFGSSLPSRDSVTARLNTNGLISIKVEDNNMSGSSMNDQMCSQVNNPNATSTTSTSTTTPPVTSSGTTSSGATPTSTAVSCATATPSSAPPSSTSPSGTLPSSSQQTTGTGPTVQSTPTTPSGPPSTPCMRDILILMDTSRGVALPSNFQAQLRFITDKLIPSWTVSLSQVEAGPYLYDSANFYQLGSAFKFGSEQELKNAIVSGYNMFLQATPSITTGLKYATETAGLWRPGVNLVTLLFTSTGDANDVNSAMQYAYQLRNNGNSVIVIAIGPNANANLQTLSPLASGPNFIFSENDYSALAVNTFLANNLNAAICRPGPPPPSTSTTTVSPPTGTGPTGPTQGPCLRDVVLLMDTSNGLGTVANFQAASFFCSDDCFCPKQC